MQLENYFDFLAQDDIRIKGTRIGIEHVLDQYLHEKKSPEEIVELFPTVTLEQVYATILYYLSDRDRVGRYVADWLEYTQQAEATYDRNPPLGVVRLRTLKASQQVPI
jgi:uncharacterized protein (DUF433 family)